MGVLNPSFEMAGAQPGLAEGWTLTTSVAGQRIAGFGPAPAEAWEDFERWLDLWLDFPPGGLTFAFFDPLAEGHEDFEESWGNDLYLTTLPSGQVIAAPFGGRAVEDIEDGWSNAPYARDWSAVSAATGVFDGKPYEDLEASWGHNQAFARLWASITAQAARFDGGSDANEDFEAGWTAATTI